MESGRWHEFPVSWRRRRPGLDFRKILGYFLSGSRYHVIHNGPNPNGLNYKMATPLDQQAGHEVESVANNQCVTLIVACSYLPSIHSRTKCCCFQGLTFGLRASREEQILRKQRLESWLEDECAPITDTLARLSVMVQNVEHSRCRCEVTSCRKCRDVLQTAG